MNIYKITDDSALGFDMYDSAIVVAHDEDDAREIHPSEFVKDWESEEKEYGIDSSWVSYKDRKDISVELIGKANDDAVRGVVLSSFNAG